MPEMGTDTKLLRVSEAAALYATANLSDALFTATQQRVLACFFGTPGAHFSVSELIQFTGAGSGAVQRELARLAGSGVLLVDLVGKQKRYRANPDCPIHDEIAGIVQKTFGLAHPIRAELAPWARQIVAAFLYGSHAKRKDTSRSDIDLMLVSDTLTYPDVMAVLHPLGERLGRTINPTILSRDELRQRRGSGNSFIARIFAQPRIWLIGNEHDLGT